mgnify:CR=1 FL=1
MKTVIITGAAGFIGSNVVGSLLARGYRVVGIDNFDPTYSSVFKEEHVAPFISNPNFILERLDICDQTSLRRVWEKTLPDYVLHLAAKADTRNAVDIPHEYISVNIVGSLNILELCREFGVRNLVIASSSSVYGNESELPWREDKVAGRPLSPYGATKQAVEILSYSYHHNFNLNIINLRFFNIYGENNRPGMVPYIWVEKMLRGEEIEISGDGSRRRDYTYVGDAVRATVQALEKPLGFEIINIGNSHPVALKELLAVFEKVIGAPARKRFRPSHAASVEVTYADISKAKRLLNWAPEILLEEGVRHLVIWFRNHRLKNPV